MKKQEDTTMRILKKENCKSLSGGSSKLTFQVGCTADSKIHIRIVSNTGGGGDDLQGCPSLPTSHGAD